MREPACVPSALPFSLGTALYVAPCGVILIASSLHGRVYACTQLRFFLKPRMAFFDVAELAHSATMVSRMLAHFAMVLAWPGYHLSVSASN